MSNKTYSQAVSRIKNAIYSFKNSLLFYPVLLATGSIAMFSLTSRIDETLGSISTINIPFLDSLLFSGSPHAARSILSTIAAGWATIMGVAFSVTLISLQLSITKHTSEVIDEFENDKLNQIMLGWFVSTVIYSLLVLKTVRTGEDDIAQIFTPVIGVNVAVFLAIVALFIFISFLHNVSKYLKPPLLINKIQKHVSNAIDQYSGREIDRNASFLQTELRGRHLLKVRSPKHGVVRRIKMDELRKEIEGYGKVEGIWIEFHVSQGEDVRQGTTIATLHSISQREQAPADKSLTMLERSIVAAIDINRNRDLLTDPTYGVEILRNIAIKSINQSDLSSVKSCVSGLFEVLGHAFRTGDIQTKPVTVTAANDMASIGVVAHLNERPIFKTILTDLATIYQTCLVNEDMLRTIASQYDNQYQLAAIELLDSNMTDQFATFTEWFSQIVALESPFEIGKKILTEQQGATLRKFRGNLVENYPHAVDAFDIHTNRTFVSEA